MCWAGHQMEGGCWAGHLVIRWRGGSSDGGVGRQMGVLGCPSGHQMEGWVTRWRGVLGWSSAGGGCWAVYLVIRWRGVLGWSSDEGVGHQMEGWVVRWVCWAGHQMEE